MAFDTIGRGHDPPQGRTAFTVGSTDIAIFTRKFMDAAIGAAHLPRGSADQVVISLRVADIDVATKEAAERGAPVVAEPRDMPAWSMRVAHLRAPEGALIEFCQYEDEG